MEIQGPNNIGLKRFCSNVPLAGRLRKRFHKTSPNRRQGMLLAAVAAARLPLSSHLFQLKAAYATVHIEAKNRVRWRTPKNLLQSPVRITHLCHDRVLIIPFLLAPCKGKGKVRTLSGLIR